MLEPKPVVLNCQPAEYLNNTVRVEDAGNSNIVISLRLGLDPLHPFAVTNVAIPYVAAKALEQDLRKALYNPLKR